MLGLVLFGIKTFNKTTEEKKKEVLYHFLPCSLAKSFVTKQMVSVYYRGKYFGFSFSFTIYLLCFYIFSATEFMKLILTSFCFLAAIFFVRNLNYFAKYVKQTSFITT